MDKLVLTVNEAAQLLGVGRSKVYDIIRTGELPSIRIGSCRRVPMDALRGYIASLAEDLV
jgi:excisionase family DNA binding protein